MTFCRTAMAIAVSSTFASAHSHRGTHHETLDRVYQAHAAATAMEHWAGKLEKFHDGIARLGNTAAASAIEAIEAPFLTTLIRKYGQEPAPSPHQPMEEGEPAPVAQFWGIFFNVFVVLLSAYFYHAFRKVPSGRYEDIKTTEASGTKVVYDGLDCTIKELFYTGDAVLDVPGGGDVQVLYGEYAPKTPEDEERICKAARLVHVQGHWKHHCLSCYQEPCTSCITCCCLPVRWAETISFVNILDFWPALALMLFLFAFRQFTPTAALFYVLFVIVGVNYRQELRRKFKFESQGGMSYATDCCLYTFCACCAVVQEARHVEDAMALDHDETACPHDRQQGDSRSECWTSNILTGETDEYQWGHLQRLNFKTEIGCEAKKGKSMVIHAKRKSDHAEA